MSNKYTHNYKILNLYDKNNRIASQLLYGETFSIINKNISLITIFPLFLLIIFLFIIFNLSNRENIKEFDASLSNIEDIRQH